VDRPAAAGDGGGVVVVDVAAVGGADGAVVVVVVAAADGGFGGDIRTLGNRPRSLVAWWPASLVTCSRAACLGRTSAT